ncbi:phosphatase PAP2 family protein [Sporosarcina sp. YIM B06819]|uniref:phosphatase PAP2 family protein n=1 Tax=Sporosarcina sp. YIM B06819 TaxID=3081769 RepID=UPI00298CFB53|nr:phosphatase PAP2 family protein [Sporosarcina sp. YIM B06819]
MRKISFALILCIGLAITFIYIATTVGNNSIASFDTTAIAFVQGLEAPWLTAILKVFTTMGSGYVVVPMALLLVVILYFGLRARPQAWLLLIVVTGTPLFNSLLKLYFKRERPDIHRILDAHGFSFPSGHAMISFSLYAIIAFIAWGFIKTAMGRVMLLLFTAFMILTISISRIYLGVHYPSDIIGGFTISALWLTIVITIYTYWLDKKRPIRI